MTNCVEGLTEVNKETLDKRVRLQESSNIAEKNEQERW